MARFGLGEAMPPASSGMAAELHALASGGHRTLAMKQGGTVWGWGSNGHG
ncbi:RCC1 domain-containing protein [Corallococcus aberystwythensis]|uniref:RCC1 repeat-containing protein n=1 Tax=Corallococcus aberystwythensis TaxID=2316722 RepID=A0A3A8PIS9_9BACT|nr:hypothetical protein D7W81_38195 [Corallococcus aberystwythensis]